MANKNNVCHRLNDFCTHTFYWTPPIENAWISIWMKFNLLRHRKCHLVLWNPLFLSCHTIRLPAPYLGRIHPIHDILLQCHQLNKWHNIVQFTTPLVKCLYTSLLHAPWIYPKVNEFRSTIWTLPFCICDNFEWFMSLVQRCNVVPSDVVV